MAAEDGPPVRPVMEADRDVAGRDLGAGFRLVLTSLVRGVVRRTVDVGGMVEFGTSPPYFAGRHDERQEANDAWVISEPSHR